MSIVRMWQILLAVTGILGTIQATTIGSDTAVSLFTAQTSLNNGDIVAGFAYLDGGFLITSNSVTATWNSSFPASNLLDLNGGALYLSTDLQTSGLVRLNSLGTIIGNNHAFEFSPTMTSFIGCGLTLTTSVALTIGPNSNGWAYNETFVSVAAQLNFVNYPFNGTTLGTLAVTGLTNSNGGAHTWHPSALFVAINTGASTSRNSLSSFSVNSGTGALTLVGAEVVLTATITSLSWHPSGLYIAGVGGVNAGTSFVQAVPVSGAGVLGTPFSSTGGAAFPSAAQSCDWSATGTYLAVGFANASATGIRIYALGGTPVSPTLTFQTSASSVAAVRSLKYNSVYGDIFAVLFTTAGNTLQVYRYNAGANTLSIIATTAVAYTPTYSVDWSADGSCLLVSNGQLLDIYRFDYGSQALTYCTSYQFSAGGFASYSPINSYVAESTNIGSPRPLDIFKTNVKSGTLYNLYISLGNDVIMQNCFLKFQGNCTIFGNGHSIDLDATATLSIDAYSSLTLKNVTVRTLNDGSIRMVHPSSQLVLDNATLVLDSNFTFTQGVLQVCNDVVLSGENLYFMYTSTSISNIAAYSTLYLDNLLTFSYAPRIGANNLLQFTDNTSQLVLNGATLSATTTGMALLGGTMVVEGHAYLSSTATNSTQAIRFGSGTSSCQNMQLHVAPAAVLEVTSGVVVNNNI